MEGAKKVDARSFDLLSLSAAFSTMARSMIIELRVLDYIKSVAIVQALCWIKFTRFICYGSSIYESGGESSPSQRTTSAKRP